MIFQTSQNKCLVSLGLSLVDRINPFVPHSLAHVLQPINLLLLGDLLNHSSPLLYIIVRKIAIFTRILYKLPKLKFINSKHTYEKISKDPIIISLEQN